MPRKKLHRRTFTFRGETIDRTFATKALADEWYSTMRRKADRVKAGLPVAKDDVLMKVAAARWIALREKTNDYWMDDETKMRRFLVPALGDKTVQEITKGDCEAALHGARLELRASGSTFNRYRACLHSFFEYVIDEGYRETNPVSRVERMAEVARGAHIPNEQVRAYIEKLRAEEPVYFAFLVLAMNAGPRTGELLAFTWSDYRPDLRRMEITKRFQRRLGRVKEGTKGGGARPIPLNDFAIAALEEFRAKTPHTKPGDLIFHRPDGSRISDRVLCDVHRRVARAAGIADTVRLYDITRHKFASEVTQKLGIRAAQELLGHSTSAITERYAHSDPGHLINRVVDTVSVGDDGEDGKT